MFRGHNLDVVTPHELRVYSPSPYDKQKNPDLWHADVFFFVFFLYCLFFLFFLLADVFFFLLGGCFWFVFRFVCFWGCVPTLLILFLLMLFFRLPAWWARLTSTSVGSCQIRLTSFGNA